MVNRLFGIVLMLIGLLGWQPAQALNQCQEQHIQLDALEKSTHLGLSLIQQLEQHQPRVAMVARVGSDLSKYGLTYSHVGLIFRDHPKGKWIFTHLLNHCNQPTSDLFDEGVIPFFNDNPFKYQALLVIPTESLQKELEHLQISGIARELHEKKYSVIANPGEAIYQNSNQWVLELLAVAKSIYLPSDKRQNAIILAKQYGFQPEMVRLGFFKHLGALLKPNIHFDDHSDESKVSGRYPFVSVRSLIEFMKYNDDVSHISEIELNRPVRNIYSSSKNKLDVKKRSGKVMNRNSSSRSLVRTKNIPAGNQTANTFWEMN